MDEAAVPCWKESVGKEPHPALSQRERDAWIPATAVRCRATAGRENDGRRGWWALPTLRLDDNDGGSWLARPVVPKVGALPCLVCRFGSWEPLADVSWSSYDTRLIRRIRRSPGQVGRPFQSDMTLSVRKA